MITPTGVPQLPTIRLGLPLVPGEPIIPFRLLRQIFSMYLPQLQVQRLRMALTMQHLTLGRIQEH